MSKRMISILLSVLLFIPLCTLAEDMQITRDAMNTAQHQLNNIHFSFQIKRRVEHDVMQTTVFVEEEGKNLKTLNTQVNKKVNFAITTAKKLGLSIERTQYRTYVSHHKSEKNGWIVRAEISLISQNFIKMREFLTQTANDIAIDNVHFSVSDAKREHLEQIMMKEAIAVFKQKANFITQQFNHSMYKVESLVIGNKDGYFSPRPLAVYAEKNTAIPVEHGETDITLNIQATISLTN